MDFSPQSLFWDNLYARCCEEMDTYLKPGSFWDRIPDEMSRVTYDFAQRYESWRWLYELRFWNIVAKRGSVNFRTEKTEFERVMNDRIARCCRGWRGLSQREKVREAKSIAKKFEDSSCVALDEYLRSGECSCRDATSRDIEAALVSSPPTKRLIAEKLIAGIESLGWKWQHNRNGGVLCGDVVIFGRTFSLLAEFEDKYMLCYHLTYKEDGTEKLWCDYGFLMGMGSGRLDSFGATDLDADVEAFMMMLSRLAWLVATSLDDAEKGVSPTFVHHPPPLLKSRKRGRYAVVLAAPPR